MQVNIVEPINLFAEAKRYIVPTFQRSYAWTRGDQWELLWDDVSRVARELDAIRALPGISEEDRTARETAVATHFLGAIVRKCD